MQCSLTEDVTFTQRVFFYAGCVTIVIGKVHDIVGEFGYSDMIEKNQLDFRLSIISLPHPCHTFITPNQLTIEEEKVHLAQVFSFD